MTLPINEPTNQMPTILCENSDVLHLPNHEEDADDAMLAALGYVRRRHFDESTETLQKPVDLSDVTIASYNATLRMCGFIAGAKWAQEQKTNG